MTPVDLVKEWPYDLNIVKAFFALKKEIKKVGFNRTDQTPEEYLQGVKNGIVYKCESRNFTPDDIQFAFDHKYAVIVKSNEGDYSYHLAMSLIAYDPIKLDSFLDYQYSQYKGKAFFPVMVENLCYEYVQDGSPFDNSRRLQLIMDWVKTKRVFVPIDEDENQKENLPEKFLWKGSLSELEKTFDGLFNSKPSKIKDNYNRNRKELPMCFFDVVGIQNKINDFRPMQFCITEVEVIDFFYQLNKIGHIEFNVKDRADLQKICFFFLNRKGGKYKLRQLQTTITDFPTLFQ